MNLFNCIEGVTYIISYIKLKDDELQSFLFTLGCYSGEPITIISKRRNGMVVAIKDGRYNIDKQLAEAILVSS